MLEIKVAVRLASLRLPFKKSLLAAAELGAGAVEIDALNELKPREMSQTGIRQIRKQLEDLQLKVSAVSFETRGSYHDLNGLDRRVEATRDALKFAYELGTNVVVNQIGRIPEDVESPDFQMLLQTITDLGVTGQRVGAMLAARTGTESGETMRRLIDELPDGSLVVDFDPGNLIINGYSASDAIKFLARDVMHVHARDGVQDLAKGRGLEVQLGRGSADFPYLLGVLEEQRYRGWLTVQRDEADNPLQESAQAVEYLKNIG